MRLNPTRYPFDLGDYRRPPAEAPVAAQRWFDRGLIWSYAFNHEEAIVCFERALAVDPRFLLAHWGVAYASGPNYNKQWDAFDEQDLGRSLRRAHEAIVRATELARGGTQLERDLIDALRARYPSAQPENDMGRRNSAYADAMRHVYETHSGDLDVAALYADALLNVTAWSLWDLGSGEPARGARTLEAQAVLETAMRQPGGMAHPGILHFYLHLMEMSPHPEKALPAADALRALVPDAGHLIHMPTHIDVLVGDYTRVIVDNERAIAADERFVAASGPLNFYSLYRAHNHHFRIYGAMFAGRRSIALEAAARLEATLPERLLRVEVPPMADWLESFVPMGLHVLVRFGMWDEILARSLPVDPELYCVTTALTHYARGVAFAATSRICEAAREREHLAAAIVRVPGSRYLFNNQALDILAIGAAMLDGEIAYRRGDHDRAWSDLRRAIELDDTLPYDEPWGWMQPTRHAYGALLLEQDQVEEAASVYAADLGLDETLPRACRHPYNVWSLHGYHECLIRLGDTARADAIAPALERALGAADIAIESSCFCRTATSGGAHCC